MTVTDIGVGDLGKFEDIDVSELASISTDPMADVQGDTKPLVTGPQKMVSV